MIPAPLSRISKDALKHAVGLCFDLDDTFTSSGRVAPAAWKALWSGHEAGLAMIPVTGRPAGWCDLICRFWPVTGVVGENGAFYFAYDPTERRVIRRFARNARQRTLDRERLEGVTKAVLCAVPRARLAADQPFRVADLAVDFAEDVGPLSAEEVKKIAAVMAAHGLVAKVSSIHVNGWYGRYDKRTMLIRFAKERLGLSMEEAKERLVYLGDSPNDAPLFSAFPHSVGVANVRRYLPEMDGKPAYICRKSEGDGFAELVRMMIRSRP